MIDEKFVLNTKGGRLEYFQKEGDHRTVHRTAKWNKTSEQWDCIETVRSKAWANYERGAIKWILTGEIP